MQWIPVLQLLHFYDLHRAGFGGLYIFLVFLISCMNGVKSAFCNGADQGALAVFLRHAPPPVCEFDAVIATNALVALLRDDDHQALTSL